MLRINYKSANRGRNGSGTWNTTLDAYEVNTYNISDLDRDVTGTTHNHFHFH